MDLKLAVKSGPEYSKSRTPELPLFVSCRREKIAGSEHLKVRDKRRKRKRSCLRLELQCEGGEQVVVKPPRHVACGVSFDMKKALHNLNQQKDSLRSCSCRSLKGRQGRADL